MQNRLFVAAVYLGSGVMFSEGTKLSIASFFLAALFAYFQLRTEINLTKLGEKDG